MAGTWKEIPSNCTLRIAVSLRRCAQWGQNIRQVCVGWANRVQQQCAQWANEGYSACSSWADEGSNQCSSWADEGSNQCSSWGQDCNWYSFWNCVIEWVCQGWYWVANLVCQAWYWVADLVCVATIWIANWVCIVFTTIVTIICVAFSFIVEFFCAVWSILTFWLCLSKANGGTAFLLTDGTVLMQECQSGYGTKRWWKLTPDTNGDYKNGTWQQAHDSHVGRKYFASAILADGRLLVCGGEYSDASGSNSQDETNRCEIYDPVADSWTEMNGPAGWAKIGDAACALLSDGKFLMGNSADNLTAIFDPVLGSWGNQTNMTNPSSEESWVLLPDGGVITADCFGHPACEKYFPSTNTWKADNPVPIANDLVEDASKEIGPGILLPDGSVFYCGATGQTALYTPGSPITAKGTWSAGPALPKSGNMNQGTKDGPDCLLVNGNVLIGIAPVNGGGTSADYLSPTTFYEFDGTNINRASDPPSSNHATYVGRMLLLPTGEVLYAREDDSSFYVYGDYGSPNDLWRPVISTCPATVGAGTTIHVSGSLFNGFSQAVGYGDDSTSATNYPLVRIENRQTGHVRYCRTFNHTTTDARGNMIASMGVATGAGLITTNVQIPANIEAGESDLFVVANGIPSLPFQVNIVRRR
jgi:hypothetical protein